MTAQQGDASEGSADTCREVARCRKLPSAHPLLNTSINEEKSSLLQNVKL